MADKKKILVICGPTATGKTGLSITLAEKTNGEIISADSMQIYKNLSVGTAKATLRQRERVPHHLVDILLPEEEYSVSDFVKMAGNCIEDISDRDKTPIVVGGTGLYIESLVNGIKFTPQDSDGGIREKLKRMMLEKGSRFMYDLLCDIDPEYAAKVHPNNKVRVIRALEVYYLTGKNMTRNAELSKPAEKPYDSFIIGLTYSRRRSLYKNIDMRVDGMISDGLIEEAEYVFKNRDVFKTSCAAIGYKEFFPYFEGKRNLRDCVDKLKQASRNYAKRQLTWFRKMERVNWFCVDTPDYEQMIYSSVKNFLT